MDFEELTLDDLEDSIVGKEFPLLVDWVKNGQLTTLIIKVKVAEPAVAAA